MTTRAQSARCDHLAADPVFQFFEYQQVDHSIVHKHCVAFGDVVNQTVVINVHGVGFLAFGSAHGELENIARLKLQVRFEIAGANGRSLCIHQDCNRAAEFLCDCANTRHDCTDPVALGVTHVEAKNIGAFMH